MTSVRNLTKQMLIELIENNYPEARTYETIATLFTVNEGYEKPLQQCILFHKVVDEDTY